MKIAIYRVEGKSKKRGSKQNRTYELSNENKGFYDGIDPTGKTVRIWNVKGDWSLVGIMTESRRMTYTENFKILLHNQTQKNGNYDKIKNVSIRKRIKSS